MHLTGIRIGVLGTLTLGVSDRPVEIRSRIQRRLLALLTLHACLGQRPQSEQLIDELWDGAPPRSATSALAVHISHLRRAGLRDVVVTTPTGYALAADEVEIDADLYEYDLRRGAAEEVAGKADSARGYLDVALRRWRGRPYDDLRYDDVAQLEIGRLERLWRTGLRARASASLTLGDPARAVEDAEALLADEVADGPALLLLAQARLALEGPSATRDVIRRARTLGADDQTLARLEHIAGSVPAPLLPTGGSTDAPAVPDPFVGRDEDVERVVAAMRQARHVSLVGAGGVGKSTLAAAVSLHATRRVLWASLSQARPESVVATVAAAMRQNAVDDVDLAAVIGGSDLVLVLDTCEHVAQRVASLVDGLLETCPGITILTTTRQVLGTTSEHVVPVSPLPATPAVTLFNVLARRSDPSFEGPADAMGELCQRLDGLPLALEIAASHAHGLGLDGLLSALQRNEDLPTKPGETAEPRMRTLFDTVGWSYRLLTDESASAFRKLAFLREPFGLSTAHKLDVSSSSLAALVAASLLLVTHRADGQTRFRMLDTVRTFGRAELLEQGEVLDVARMVVDAVTDLDAVDHHAESLQEACIRTRDAGDVARAAKASHVLARLWLHSGAPADAGTQLRAVADALDPEAASDLLLAAGRVEAQSGDTDAALRSFQDALARTRRPLVRVELQRRRGELLSEVNRSAEADEAFVQAEVECDRFSDESTVIRDRTWLDVALSRCLLAYRRFDLDQQESLLERMTAVAARSYSERHDRQIALRRLHAGFQSCRYAPPADWQTLLDEDCRAAEKSGRPAAIAAAFFRLGFFHVIRYELDPAIDALERAREENQRVGRSSVHVPAYLVTALRLKGDEVEVERIGTAAADFAASQGRSEYVALVQGSLAWHKWRDGRTDEAVGLAEMALQRWRHHPHPYPLQWTALLPLIAARHDQGVTAAIPALVEQLLRWPQQQLPELVAAAAQQAREEPSATEVLVKAAVDAHLL